MTTTRAAADPWENTRREAVEYLSAIRETQEIPGLACMVLVGSEIVMEEAIGSADLERNVALTLDTRFQIGSLTKTFVAASTMLAADRKRLDLDAPLSDLLHDTPDSWSGLTLRHLLSHTGGVVDYTEFPEIRQRYQLEVSHDQILAEMRAHDLQFEPGSQWAYSNSGYHFVGLALEQAAERSLGEILHESIFEPAGMSSAELISADGCDDCAVGYVLDGDVLVAGPHNSSTWSYAAGAVAASARDLGAWIQALSRGAPVPHPVLRKMWTAAVPRSGEPAPYGLGTQLQSGPGFTLAYHTGSRPGFHATMGTLVEKQLSVIVLLNRSEVDSFPIAQRLAYLFGKAMSAESGR